MGLDYNETFNLVMKPTTIRIIFTIAISRGWSMHQLYVHNAFIYKVFNETVYMVHSPRFEDSSHPNHVCKLHQSLYGHKHESRAWFTDSPHFFSNMVF